MGKHAYLIMAHHRADLLKELIKSIDDERNDIFLHIDKKSNLKKHNFTTKKSHIYFINPMKVNWGGYTQVECEYRLLAEAYIKEAYDYYHFLTGATYPLKTQDEIHLFFDKNKGMEFIGYDNKNDFSFRAKYYFLFNEAGKPSTIIKKIKWKIRKLVLYVQKLLNYNKLSNKDEFKNIIIKKGMAYVSITNEFVKYVLEKEPFVKHLLKHSISADEIFLQTLAYNSNFRDNLYNINDEFEGCLREFAWEDAFGLSRTGHNFIDEDLDYLLHSSKCFALKFEGKDGMNLIKKIREKKNIT